MGGGWRKEKSFTGKHEGQDRLCFKAVLLLYLQGWLGTWCLPWVHVRITLQLLTDYIRLCGDEAQAVGFVPSALGDSTVETALRTSGRGNSEGETSQDLPRQGWR